MKKLFALLLTAALLLCACAAKPQSDPAKLEYPGLPWGSSPEETLEALGLTQADIFQDAETPATEALNFDVYTFQVKDLVMFDHKAVSAVFRFEDYTQSGNYQLCEIRIYYPDGYHAEAVDRDAVQAELEAVYGPALEQYDTYYWNFGEVSRTGNWPTYPTWRSETTTFDLMTEEEVALFYEFRRTLYADLSVEDLPTDEEIQLVDDISVARISFLDSCDETAELTDAEREEKRWTNNELILHARTLIGWDDTFATVVEYMENQGT